MLPASKRRRGRKNPWMVRRRKVRAKLYGHWELRKIDSETGKVISVHKGRNEFLDAGEHAFADRCAGTGTAWTAANMRLRIYTGFNVYTELRGSQSAVSVTLNSNEIAGELVYVWIDGPGNAYNPHESYGVRPTVNAVELASHTDTLGWGSKTASETWQITWTVTMTTSSTSGLTWQPAAGVTPGYAYMFLNMVCDGNSISAANYSIRGTDDTGTVGSRTYDQTLTSVSASAADGTLTITSRREGGSAFTLRGERIGVTQGSLNFALAFWDIASSPLVAEANQGISLTHEFVFTDA